MKELWRRLNWFFHRQQFERELDEEMQHHLALKAEEHGSTETAQRAFGNLTLLKEDSRLLWMGTYTQQFGQDIRYGLRSMAAHKIFTVMAVLSLALGIGANTAIFSFMDAIMFRALPVRHPEQLAIINWRQPTGDWGVVHSQMGDDYDKGGWRICPNFPYPVYQLLRDRNHTFSTLFAYATAGRLNLVLDGQATLGEGQYVSGNYFDSLGVTSAIGRLIKPADDQPAALPIVNLSYSFWQSHFGSRPDIIGKEILIDGKPFTITGVTPSEFFGVRPPTAPEVFIPVHQFDSLDLNPHHHPGERFTGEHFYWIEVMGRLKPGATLAGAEAELGGLFQPWVQNTAANDQERRTLPRLFLQEGGSGVDFLRRRYSKPLFILMAMTALILTVACANISNLLLARSHTRRREIAVRLSLGASRQRVVRQLLTESILLSGCGGLLGVFVAVGGIHALTLMLANGQADFSLRAQLDGRILLFTSLVVLATGILFGLAPALQATKVDVMPALKETRAGAPHRRTRLPFGLGHTLIVAQIAISLLLAAVAGLFVRTLNNLHAVNIGFNPQNLLLFSIDARQAGYEDTSLKNFYAELQRRFASIPGVRAATTTDTRLLSDSRSRVGVVVPGLAPDSTAILQVGPEFFQTMQIPLRTGRAIEEKDSEGHPHIAVVNEVFAKKYFPGASVIGKYIGINTPKGEYDTQIIGLAKTALYDSLRNETPPVVYVSYRQADKHRPLGGIGFALRTVGDPLTVTKSVRRIVHELAPTLPVADLTTQSQVIEGTIVQERTFAQLCTVFGLLALLMASIGLYGTLAYTVTRRTSEIGIRMALGAMRSRIIWMVVREVLILVGIGLIAGFIAVWQTTVFLQSFLFGLKPNDPWTLCAAASILIACALLASYTPAWRAACVDPASALRHE